MKAIFYRYLPVLLLSFACSGCESSEGTLNYFLEHPVKLEKKLRFCNSTANKTSLEVAECEIAVDAQAIIRAYVEAMQADPERFGQRILDTETLCSQLQDKMIAAEEGLARLQAEKASATALAEARARLDQAQKDYNAKNDEVKVLLAVAGLSSPD